jgi:DNA-binding response OmpR family regulator
MSGYAATAISERGILDADIAFIGKPFTPNSLVLKVEEVLRQKNSTFQSVARKD